VEYLVKDIEELANRLRDINSKKATEEEKGLHRIRGSIDLTFEDEEKKDKGVLKMVGCYALTKRGFFGRKIRYFDVSMNFERGERNYYKLTVTDIKTYTMDRGAIRLIDERAPEDLFNLIDEDLREAGAKKT